MARSNWYKNQDTKDEAEDQLTGLRGGLEGRLVGKKNKSSTRRLEMKEFK